MKTARERPGSDRGATRTRRVLIVDDHPPILLGLHAILDVEDDITVCGEARTCDEAEALMKTHQPDVVVVDTTLPEAELSDWLRVLRRSHPAAGIVALCERPDCDRALELLDAGMSGCVSKSDAPQTIVDAVRTVADGLVYLNPLNAQRLTRAFRTLRSDERRRLDVLSETERQVLAETAAGFTAPEVAERLGVPLSSVNTSRNRLMQKLGLHNRADLVHFALQAGLLSAASSAADS